MKVFRCPFRFRGAIVLAVTAGALLAGAGCKQVFVPKHRVIVDAIAAPDVPKPAGKSYKLVARRSVVSNLPVQIPVLKACVDAALAGEGLYESPPNTPPELFIEVSYGRDASPRALASVRETYLQLSARSNPQRSLERATGPELWDVRAAVLGVSGSIETALPLLSAVAAEHMATNTGIELKIEVPQNAPMIESVRLAAIQALDAQAQKVAAAQANAPMAAGTNGTAPATATPPARSKPIIEPLPPPPPEEKTEDGEKPGTVQSEGRFRH